MAPFVCCNKNNTIDIFIPIDDGRMQEYNEEKVQGGNLYDKNQRISEKKGCYPLRQALLN